MLRHRGFKGLYVLEIGIQCTGMGVLRDFMSLKFEFGAQAWGFKGLYVLEAGILCARLGGFEKS